MILEGAVEERMQAVCAHGEGSVKKAIASLARAVAMLMINIILTRDAEPSHSRPS